MKPIKQDRLFDFPDSTVIEFYGAGKVMEKYTATVKTAVKYRRILRRRCAGCKCRSPFGTCMFLNAFVTPKFSCSEWTAK